MLCDILSFFIGCHETIICLSVIAICFPSRICCLRGSQIIYCTAIPTSSVLKHGLPVVSKFSHLSRFISLRRPQALANCHITHILSVISWHFEDGSQLTKGYKHLHILVDDVDNENLLTWFARGNRFIDEGLNPRRTNDDVTLESRHETPTQNDGKCGVLMHW